MFKRGSLFSQQISASLSKEGSTWKFNPPAAPHFGGIWEAAVKSVKYHLKRVVGETRLTFEEFSTLLCQVEACLNSRPLIPLWDDPHDLLALTPAHFLIGDVSLLFTEPRITEENIPLILRWRRTTQFVQRFWDVWSQAYLQQLQKRVKWKDEQPPVKVGDLVILKNELTPPTRWPLGRITSVFPAADGLIRVVEVKTATTTLKRPIVKIIRLFEE